MQLEDNSGGPAIYVRGKVVLSDFLPLNKQNKNKILIRLILQSSD